MLRVHAVTLVHALSFLPRNVNVLPEGGLSGTLEELGDRNVVYHDADFVLFGLTAEEISWLQSRVCRTVRHGSSSSASSAPSSMGETRTSCTESPPWCPGSVACAPVFPWASTDVRRLRALAHGGSGMSFEHLKRQKIGINSKKTKTPKIRIMLLKIGCALQKLES